MSIFGMMRTSSSGMAAQSNRLGTVSDNIANASTHGYKRAFTEFSTIVLESGGSEYVPGSVDTQIRYGISAEGGLDFTTSKTDLAIRGEGFFMVGDESDATYMTRAGSFVKNDDGELINAAGFKLLGYPLANGSPAVSANGTAGLEPVTISAEALAATPSTSGTFSANLPADATAVASPALPSDNQAGNDDTATVKTSLVLYDNYGAEKSVDIYFTLTDASTNTWELAVYEHADADPAATGPFPYANPALVSQTMTFDSSGQISSGNSASFTITGGSAFTLDLGNMSQLSGDYQLLSATVDGNAPSSVVSHEFAPDGTFFLIYGNNARVAAYRIPLATVASIDNLQPEAGNVYLPSAESGDLQLGFPGDARFGSLRSSALEKSTVDTASELTTMIESQYAYVANSKVFQTAGELMEVLVNLKR